jgi:hypothetical protein
VAKLGETIRQKSVVIRHLPPYIDETLIEYWFERTTLSNGNLGWNHNPFANVTPDRKIFIFQIILRTKPHIDVPPNVTRRKVASVVNATMANNRFCARDVRTEWHPWLNPDWLNT